MKGERNMAISDIQTKKNSMPRNIKYKRIFLIVLDSCGIGAMKDAGNYGDAGADT